jgi:hypothetical protein
MAGLRTEALVFLTALQGSRSGLTSGCAPFLPSCAALVQVKRRQKPLTGGGFLFIKSAHEKFRGYSCGGKAHGQDGVTIRQ